jgi:hypothetical protein
MLLRRLVADILPAGAPPLLGSLLLLPPPSTRHHAVVIEEFDGALYNRVFLAARAYVSTLLAAARAGAPVAVKASLPRGAGTEQITLSMRPGTVIVDVFRGAELTWHLGGGHGAPWQRRADGGAGTGEAFRLSFDGRHKDLVLGAYLPFVMARVEAMAREQRQAKLYSNEWGKWRPVRLRNASTFATLAMDAALRQDVVGDLDMFGCSWSGRSTTSARGARGRGATSSMGHPAPASPASSPRSPTISTSTCTTSTSAPSGPTPSSGSC